MNGVNKPVALILILISLTALCAITVKPVRASAPVADSWMSKAPMPTPRFDLGVAVVYGKIYAIGGSNEGSGFLGTNEMYDPQADKWTTMAPMPTPRSGFGVAVYQNKIYVIGGCTGYAYKTSTFLCPIHRSYHTAQFMIATGANEVYDPLTDTWETKTPMPTKRANLCANVVGDSIYLTAGYTEDPDKKWTESPAMKWYSTNEVYDPSSDRWTAKALIPTPVSEYASAVIDNKIYAISGSKEYDNDGSIAKLNQVYRPGTNTWVFETSIPTGVRLAAAAATTGTNAPKRIYVLGGVGPVSLNQVYDPESKTWTTGASMPTARYGLGVAVIDDLLYTMGGSISGTATAKNEQYTPAQYTTSTSSSQEPSPEHTTPSSANSLQTGLMPAIWVVAAVAIGAIVGVGLLVYFKKRKH